MSKNEDENNYPPRFHSDYPVNDFNIDYFGYKPIAKEVASSIIQINTQFGYVISINGKWGSGKSSFIFYVEQYLTEQKDELSFTPKSNEIITFKFDPWLFSGHQDIINQFFYQIQAQTKINSSLISKPTLELLNTFFEYGSNLKTVPTLEGQCAGWGFTALHKITDKLIQKSVKTIFELKTELITKLGQNDAKIVIFIDDIDRLNPEEIQELFRAIKAIGNFPNIVYILSFDEEIVTTALNLYYHPDLSTTEQNKRHGNKYLEKIVQFSISLPLIPEHQLKKYIETIIFDSKFKNTNSVFLNNQDWFQQYYEGLNKLLITPRSIIRLNNALLLLYPPLENEVDVIDFICLEVIRQNYPELYNWIRDNPRFFIKSDSLIDSWLEKLVMPSIITEDDGLKTAPIPTYYS